MDIGKRHVTNNSNNQIRLTYRKFHYNVKIELIIE